MRRILPWFVILLLLLPSSLGAAAWQQSRQCGCLTAGADGCHDQAPPDCQPVVASDCCCEALPPSTPDQAPQPERSLDGNDGPPGAVPSAASALVPCPEPQDCGLGWSNRPQPRAPPRALHLIHGEFLC